MPNKIAKNRRGTVVADAMDKTVVVRVDRIKTHPIYRKKFVMSKNIKAHDEKNEFKTGDLIEISETRPISKGKNFIAVRKVK